MYSMPRLTLLLKLAKQSYTKFEDEHHWKITGDIGLPIKKYQMESFDYLRGEKMRLQNLSVIFIIIMIPIILVVSYYMSLQADTLNMQSTYETKLMDSTKEAIDAFEINTVEWNQDNSEVADFKRRVVTASINTFTNSFANNLGVSGTSKEYILANVPAIAVTLYDGYYIYSPAEVRKTVKDGDGSTVFYSEDILAEGEVYNPNNKNKILYEYDPDNAMGYPSDAYVILEKEDGTTEEINATFNIDAAKTEYKHILKPFTTYSEKAVTGEGDNVVINYTLDNYISIYGNTMDTDGEERYVSRGGYLTNLDKFDGSSFKVGEKNSISAIKYDGIDIDPEILSETVAYVEESGVVKKEFIYVYSAENTKVYYDIENDGEFFIVKDQQRINTSELSEAAVPYKKCTIPKQYASGKITYVEIYQKLLRDDSGNYNWYKLDENNNYILTNISIYDGVRSEPEYDYSAINYCVESYVFTKWINSLNLKAEEKLEDDTTKEINIQIRADNDPEDSKSDFCIHKRNIIKKAITENLNQAITSYSENSPDVDFKMPELTEEDWDKILRNTSIITFAQNIPIGLKYYNDYAIATSTLNKEYVDPNEIYLYDDSNDDDKYYHIPYCENLTDNNLIGYRSIDFVQRYYEIEAAVGNEKIKKYYFKHQGNTQEKVTEACYECLIQKSLYKVEENTDKLEIKKDAYNTALARERYIARKTKLPAEIEPTYSFVVVPVENATGEIGDYTILGGAKYTIVDTYNRIEANNRIGEQAEIIRKTDAGNEFTITATVDGTPAEGNSPDGTPIIADGGSLDDPRATVITKNNFAVYESNAQANLKIDAYEDTGLGFTVSGTESNYKVFYMTERVHKELGGEETYPINNPIGIDDDGVISFYLKYKKNYNREGSSNLKAFANINNYNDLTIATQMNGISGKVVLNFYNPSTNAEFWSKNVFEINDGDVIYCKISGNEDWYKNDWQVSAYAVDYTTKLAEGTVDFYTIRAALGLEGLSKAVNAENGAVTTNREFYLIEDIDINNLSARKIDPIGQDASNKFNGTFSGANNINGVTLETAPGGNHKIENLNINVVNSIPAGKDYAFGMFGWIGSSGQITNLNINRINATYGGTKTDIKLGGIAGNSEVGSVIKDINITEGTITGGTYAGGIVGNSGSAISNCSVNNAYPLRAGEYAGGIAGNITSGSISNCNVYNISEISANSYAGGIVGKTVTSISHCNVDRIGLIKSTKDSGGIVGNAKGSISNCNVNSIEKIVGGEGSTGGIAGYSETSISNCSVNNNASITNKITEIISEDNAGGIVGNIISGSISNCNVKYLTNIKGKGSIGGIAGYSKASISNTSINVIDKIVDADNSGGIAGYIESSISDSSANSVGEITGTERVGGIAGHITSSISNCSASVNTIKNANFSESKYYELCIGGIAGYTTGVIQNTSISVTTVGNGNVTMKKAGSIFVDYIGIEVKDINKYSIGGIAGYTNSNITGTTINNNVEIKGGKVLVGASEDEKAFTAAGGRVGYKKSNQYVDSSWAIDCYVSGDDNVGGIIGYNEAGSINGIERKSDVYGSGDNVGGIVGLNTGGTISWCKNKAVVTGVSSSYGENVGGIVGLNNGANIENCINENTVNGNKNVGGIAGLAYGGKIESCGNINTITGKKNTNNLNIWYYTGPETCTGTGGITGKIHGTIITRCYNNADIICNFNGGGITGLVNSGKIEYSYNSATITNSQETTVLKSNRLGGIAGAGNSIYIDSCYNIGNIIGREDSNVLSSGMGGIIGTVVDNSWYLYIGSTEPFPNSKYLSEIKIPAVKWGETDNSIINCYNTGRIYGGLTTGKVDFEDIFEDFSLNKLWDFIWGTIDPNDSMNHMCGIAGTILWAPESPDDKITLINNYYYVDTSMGRNDVVAGARGSWSNIINRGIYKASSKSDMKHQLYKLASKPARAWWII